MSRRLPLLMCVLMLAAAPVVAQTVSGDRWRLNTGPCVFRSGSGSPEAAVTGNPCDTYVRTDPGGAVAVWSKVSGSATNTGWQQLPGIGLANFFTAEQSVVMGTNVNAFRTYVSGDGYTRFQVRADGLLTWGSGAAAGDTNLYRSAADTLRTGDNFTADAVLTAGGVINSYGDTLSFLGAGIAAPATTTAKFLNQSGIGPTIEGTAIQLRTGAATPAHRWDIDPSGHLGVGANWAYDIAEDTVRVRTLYAAELNVWELVARIVISTIGGEIWTAPTTKLTTDLGDGAGDTTITVEHNFLAANDHVTLKSILNEERMMVTAGPGGGAGAYTYTVTRNLDGTGRNAWLAGSAVVSTGTTGDGLISQYAESSAALSGAVGPATAYIVRTGTTWNNLAARCVVGNLEGTYGYVAQTWGLACGDPSNAWVKVDATNGVRIGHDTTTKISLAADGTATFTGTITAPLGNIGGFTIAATLLSAGTDADYVAMSSGGTNAFWAGDSTFADADFSVTAAGALKAVSGAIGGMTLAANTLSSGTDADYVAISSAGTNAFWAGDSTFADAEFSVTAAGALKATSATLTGSLTTGVVEISATNGIYLTASGDDDARKIRWTDGTVIYARTDSPVFVIEGGPGSQINMYATYMKLWGGAATGDYGVFLDGDILAPNASGSLDLGSMALPWGEIWIAGALRPTASGTLGTSTYRFSAIYIDPSSTTSADAPVVYSSTNHTFYYKTDGVTDAAPCSGSGVTDLAVESGIVTSVSCASPGSSPTARIAALEAEVAELRAAVLQLLSKGNR